MQQFQCDACGAVVTDPAPLGWMTVTAACGPVTTYFHLCPAHDLRQLLCAGGDGAPPDATPQVT